MLNDALLQPFDLDYFQTLYTLCDILCEVYQKILSFVGPMTTANAPSPYLGQPQTASSQHLRPSDTAYNTSGSSLNIGAGQDRRVGVGLSPMLVEVVIKIDGKLKVRLIWAHSRLSPLTLIIYRKLLPWSQRS